MIAGVKRKMISPNRHRWERRTTKGRKGARYVQGLAPALEESRKKENRPVVEVHTRAVLVAPGRGCRARARGAGAERDDVRRARGPLDARDEGLRGGGPGVGTRRASARVAAAVRGDRGARLERGHRVHRPPGRAVHQGAVEEGVRRGDERELQVGHLGAAERQTAAEQGHRARFWVR